MYNINILNKLKLHFNIIKKYNINYIFNSDKNRFNNFSILFNKCILIDFSKNILNKYTINLLLNLFNKLNYLNKLNFNNLNYKKIICINKSIIDKINTVYNNKIYNNKNLIKNIVIIGDFIYKYEIDLIFDSLKEYKDNDYRFYYLSYLNINNLNIINSINFKYTIFIILCKTYENIELIEIINFIKNIFNKNISEYYNFLDNNVIVVTSNINNYLNIDIKTNNIININDNLDLNINSIYYIGIILLTYLGSINFNNFISGIYDINNNFIYEKKIYNNISIILSLIDIWYLIFFKLKINLLFIDYNLNRFINYYIFLHNIINKKNSFYSSLILGSSNIFIQDFFYKLLLKNINYEFIVFCNNKNFIFERNYNNYISNLLYKSMNSSFININKNNINNFLFKTNNNNLICKLYNNYIKNIPNNFILLNKLNPYNISVLLYIYKYRVLIKNLILSNIYCKKYETNNSYNIDILNLKSEKQETEYDLSTNELINFYKKNRYMN